MIPTPTDLSYFAEVAIQLNLSQAAKKLNISQPSLTLAIQRLENMLGTPILIRHKRGVTLTKAGQKLHAHIRELLDQWNKIKTNTLAAANNVEGTVSIGCHPSVGLFALPLFLPALIARYPELTIHLKHDISRRITDQVINLNIDIGIVVNPEKHADLVIKQLDTDKVTLWRSKKKAHNNNNTIICDPQLGQTQTILKNMKQAGLSCDRILTSSSLEVIAELTQHGAGIGILPGNIARLYQVQKIPKAPFYEDEICLLYRGENRNVKVIQVIADAIKAGFE